MYFLTTDSLYIFYDKYLQLRVKQEIVKDEKRMKFSASSINQIDFAQESRLMLDALRKYENIGTSSGSLPRF